MENDVKLSDNNENQGFAVFTANEVANTVGENYKSVAKILNTLATQGKIDVTEKLVNNRPLKGYCLTIQDLQEVKSRFLKEKHLSGAKNTTNTISNSSYSKIKPGLLKGNLAGKEAVITRLCEKYGVDVALVVTIIGQESGFGTSNLAKHNNFMGYRAAGDCGKSPNGFGYFSTPEKGLEVAIRNLSKYPERYPSVKKADMNNIDAIGRIYCEGNTYASAIKKLYNSTVKGYLA